MHSCVFKTPRGSYSSHDVLPVPSAGRNTDVRTAGSDGLGKASSVSGPEGQQEAGDSHSRASTERAPPPPAAGKGAGVGWGQGRRAGYSGFSLPPDTEELL